MKLTLLILGLCCAAHAAPVPLFDGKTLAGWEIPDAEKKWWKVEDGKIVGGSLEEKVPLNTFLSAAKPYANFDLRFKVKLTQKEGFTNSGIQVRSLRGKDGHMAGYQVDAGKGYWGTIWDEHRRNKKIAEPVDAKALAAVVEDFGWNEYRILCEGPRIRNWINGVLAIDYVEKDPAIPLTGLIGFQAHSGGKFLVEFKDITIEEMAAKPAFQGAPEPDRQPIEGAKPRTPQEQQAAFHLPPGFEIELVAAEDPAVPAGKFISVYFDQRGRMWTHTALEYPVDANENAAVADALYASKAKDKILIYNREAVFGKPLPADGLKPDHVFADGLAIPLGILPWGDGSKCYAQHGRDIVLVPHHVPDERLWPQRIPPVIALSQVASCDAAGLVVDTTVMAEAVVEIDRLNSAKHAIGTDRTGQRIVQRAVKAEIKSLVSDDALVAAYKQHGSYRKAAEALSAQTETKITKDVVRRAVERQGGIKEVMQEHDTPSVSRIVASHRRDRAKKMSQYGK